MYDGEKRVRKKNTAICRNPCYLHFCGTFSIFGQTVFPEISFEDAAVLHGLEITFVIKNGSREGSMKLLEKFGMPFEKEAK